MKPIIADTDDRRWQAAIVMCEPMVSLSLPY